MAMNHQARSTRSFFGASLPFALSVSFSAATVGVGCSDTKDPAPVGATGAKDAGTGASGNASDPGKGGLWITVSGEDLAGTGYEWTPSGLAAGDPPAFVDGWALSFEHVLVTVDHLRLNSDPDKDEGNPKSLGPLVASADGPWAVDLVRGGEVVGKSRSPDEKTIPIAAFQSQADGQPFDPQSRYAFSYEFVAASSSAKPTNLDAEAQALYEAAKEKGWAMVFSGTARYRGPAAGDAGATVFDKIPRVVKFTLGMANPTSYINCRNTDLQEVGGEFPRGVQVSASRSTIVQITLHTDHVFWNRLNVEGTPLHFDPIAARASTYGTPQSPGEVTMIDLVDVDVTGFQTRAGEPLPWRSLVSDFSAPAGQLKFDANGTTFAKANSFASFLAYTAASGGHMNADGECEVQHNFTP